MTQLRITFVIPLLLLLLTVIGSIIVFEEGNRRAIENIRNEAVLRMKLDITRLQNILYNLLTEYNHNPEAAALYLSVTAMDPVFKKLIVADGNDIIIMANRYLWNDQRAIDIENYDAVIAQDVRQVNSPRVFFDENDPSLVYGYYPLVMQLEGKKGLGRKKLGILFSELSLADAMNHAKIAERNRSFVFAGVMVFISLIIGLFLHLLVSRRLAHLTNVAKGMSSGNLYVKAELGGHDELTQLADAFDEMLDRIKEDIHHREIAESNLRELNDTLEQRISERTQELEDKKQELLESQALAHQASKLAALGEMASGIAHEVNSPLQAISLLSYKLQRLAEKGDAVAQKEVIERIDKSIQSISTIIEGLRKMSRESSNDPLEQVGIKDIIDDVMGITSERYILKGIKIDIEYKNDAQNSMLSCQRIRIGQIIINLLNNAYDAVKDCDEKWILVEVSNEEDTIRVIVTDSGRGIEQKDRDRIFEPMYTTKNIGEGTGLGLSISMEIARQHGGSLIFDPVYEHTRFILSLPKKVPDL